MTPEREHEVERICQAALDRPPAERAAFVAGECAGDEALRREVTSLLRQQSTADELLQRPALEMAAAHAIVPPALAAGQQIGPYQIQELLDAGGMGVVYKAQDMRPKLNRTVAIKVLPPDLREDPALLQRFEREGRTLAALNHAHICTVFDVGQEDGIDFLAMEYVAGQTLADRLKTSGKLPVGEALAIAADIADALEAAHEKGIIHRDLKPANIKINADGVVKVLDFGLAKITRAATSGIDLSQSPTGSQTREGTTIGTAAYMSPEQARGQPVDKRADVWAFGCVLYEMLTGRMAFPGETLSDTIAAVLAREPDWRVLPGATPDSIRRLLRRCLERDLKRRLRDIGDARIEIGDALTDPASTSAGRPDDKWRRIAVGGAVLAAVAVAFMAASLTVVRRASSPSAPPERRFEIVPPPSGEPALAISPDGEMLAFAATSNGEEKLWLHFLSSGLERPLPGTDRARYPFWSPDSRSIAFFVPDASTRTPGQRQLKRIDVESGSIEALTTAQGPGPGTWNRDGVILFRREFAGPIVRIGSTGGGPVQVTQGTPRVQGFPSFLPDDRHFLFLTQNSDPETRGIYVGGLEDSEPRRLLDAQMAVFHPPTGQLLFVRQGTLFAQRLDRTRWQMIGNPYPVADRVSGLGAAGLSVSRDGTIAYRVGSPGGMLTRQFAWFNRSGHKLANVGGPFDGGASPSMSHDGRRVAMYRRIDGQFDIWLLDLERGVVTRFTLDAGDHVNPVWSPDGQGIVYLRRTKGASDLYQRPADTAGREEPLLVSDQDKSPVDWSSDGRFVLYQNTDPKTGNDLWALPTDRDRRPFPVVRTKFEEQDGQFSPDARWLAYQSNQSGRAEIYVQRFPGPGTSTQVSLAGGSQARWRRDGRELFYVAPDNRLMAVTVRILSKEGTISLGAPTALFSIGADVQYVVSADGQRFLINTLQGGQPTAPIAVIINWKAKP